MAAELFAGICVGDFDAARPWYERLLGSEPSFLPHETEAVWELGEHRWVYIVEDGSGAGGGRVTLLVDDLDAIVDAIASRGIEPAERETYSNGVRKVASSQPVLARPGLGFLENAKPPELKLRLGVCSQSQRLFGRSALQRRGGRGHGSGFGRLCRRLSPGLPGGCSGGRASQAGGAADAEPVGTVAGVHVQTHSAA